MVHYEEQFMLQQLMPQNGQRGVVNAQFFPNAGSLGGMGSVLFGGGASEVFLDDASVVLGGSGGSEVAGDADEAGFGFDGGGVGVGAARRLNPNGSAQIRAQFRKTKMCTFNMKNRCVLGASCSFAHSEQELQSPPNLAKTKLCHSFILGRCNDRKCRFAHGQAELRWTDHVYKTELCHWSSLGFCRAGRSCRYAHNPRELRR